LVREVLALLNSQIANNDIVVRTSLAEPPPFVPGDPVQLQQVTLNLITNAIEAMANVADRDRILRISTQAQGSEVLLDISDSGHGIELQNLKRIFEAFYTTKTHGMEWDFRSAARSCWHTAAGCQRLAAARTARSSMSCWQRTSRPKS